MSGSDHMALMASGGGPPPAGSFIFGNDDSWQTSSVWSPAGTVEFPTCNIGPAYSDRWAVVYAALIANSTSAIDDILVNDASVEMIQNRVAAGSGNPYGHGALGRLKITAGTTCNVKVQLGSLAAGSVGVYVFTMSGGDQLVHASGGADAGTSTNINLARPAQPTATLYFHVRAGSGSVSISGLTSQLVNATLNTKNVAGGYLTSASAGTFSHGAFANAAAVGAVFK